MQRLRNLTEIYQKRLLRPTYAQHQATPYLVSIDPSLRSATGQIVTPKAADTVPLARSADAFTLNSSLTPGLCLTRTAGETVTVSTGSTTVAELPFGLLGNWIGGDYDDIGSENEVACWRGPDSTFTLLAPAWNDTGLAAAFTASQTTGVPVYLYAGTDGRLVYVSSPTGTQKPVAFLVDRPASSRIIVNLVV